MGSRYISFGDGLTYPPALPCHRSRFPIRKLADLVDLRRRYMATYTELTRRTSRFVEAPGYVAPLGVWGGLRRWWSRETGADLGILC